MEKILEHNQLDKFKTDYTLYAVYVTIHRILADYRDGLKPVQRKIIYSMYNDNKATSKSNKVKSTAVIGTVMNKYHPHGDSSIYGAIKPMANWFEINKPLISTQGNFGNIDGYGAAAARYTEVYLSKFGMDCVISELQEARNSVDWIDTYDSKDIEPEYLPASVPILLINGSFGIGVGMKVEIPRHNINEVIDATIKLIHNPNAQITLVPDHCLPCEIVDTNFKAISNKGFGSYKVRGVIDISEYNGKPALIIRSIPDMTYLNSITSKIEDLIKTNKLIQIADTIDMTGIDDRELKFIYVLKKGSDPEFVRQVIYKNTPMEQNCRVNFEVLDGLKPLRMSYKSYLQAFIEFRKTTKFRMYCNRLQQLKTRLHAIEPFIKIVKSGEINTVIELVRKQKDVEDSTKIIEKLIKLLHITDLQAKFILDTPIRKLSLGYLNKYCEEEVKLTDQVNECMSRVTNDDLILQEIIDELLLYKEKYGNPRRCKIIKESDISDIPQGEFKIIITQNNYIKKVNLNDPIGSYKGDSAKCIIKAQNNENIIIFDEVGRVFKLPVHKIAFSSRNDAGTDIRLLLKNLTSNINTVMYEPTIKEFSKKINKCYMTVITAAGNIKKMDLEDFLSVTSSGTTFIKLNPGDIVKDVLIVSDQVDLIVYSDNKALRFSMEQVPHLKRNTKGVNCMSNSNHIDGLSVITPNTTDIVIVTNKGKINRFSPSALPRTNRNKAGHNITRLGKSDRLNAIYGLNINDTIRVFTSDGTVDIKVSDIPSGSSVSSGTKMTNNVIKCSIIRGGN